MQKIINKINNGLKGTITIPADKSISHRAVMFASLANGKSVIKNFSKGQDPFSSLKVCKALGIDAEFKDNLVITSNGNFSAPSEVLDCGNSGTTMRLMSGILAGQNFTSTLIGDESLSKRPMKRVIEPLNLMGAEIKSNSFKAPLTIYGKKLHPIDYVSKLASAQVKSCILLAGLNVDGKTTFTEPYISRNHTEIMLKYMGANISVDKNTVTVEKSQLEPRTIEVCGDISSAAYFIVAGLIVPNSKIILKNVGLNPTRTGILEVAEKMGGNIEILDKRNISGEDVGDIQISYSDLKSCVIEGEIIPRLIDELPVIAVLATQAEGTTVIKDAQDLRNKESDRIKAVVTELKKIGANIEETPDGFIINGKTNLKGDTEVDTYHDHRLAMSLYAAGLICDKPISINGFEWVDISFPEFDKLFTSLTL
ncbi:MAG TPA: 3-phosphoshikimate 1-carboxyvinyltransferase [Candidatus Stercorousia faecigallinarum]|nr:3-phosphoshikimate 1-carboxyvinyltransferase [Candidatus Stercorousia faecigallinarum]